MAGDGLPAPMLERIRRHRVLEADRREAAAALSFRALFGRAGTPGEAAGVPFAPAAAERAAAPPGRAAARDDRGADYLLPRPCTPAELDWASEALGFPLPAMVQQLYLEVGNGGFGPANSFFGLERLVAEYQDLTDGADGPGSDAWPAALLPIADLDPGFTCLDVESGRIVDWSPEGLSDEKEGEWDGIFTEAAPDLLHWLSVWLDELR